MKTESEMWDREETELPGVEAGAMDIAAMYLKEAGMVPLLPAEEEQSRLRRAARKLTLELGREPTDGELAAELGWSMERTQQVRHVSTVTVSLDAPVGEEGESYLGEFIPDVRAEDPVESAMNASLEEGVRRVLGGLTEREQYVIEMRFGFIDGRAHTLEEVGAQLQVTRERVRQIEAKALRKLRHGRRNRKLIDFTG